MAILIVLTTVGGCGFSNEVDALRSTADTKKVWGFFQFNVTNENGKLESYYYYGKVSANLYDRIKQNKIQKGFLFLDEAQYWGEDDKIHAYRDEESSGELVFRIEDIKRIQLLRHKPGVERSPTQESGEKSSASVENDVESIETPTVKSSGE